MNVLAVTILVSSCLAAIFVVRHGEEVLLVGGREDYALRS
jgi:hypothetical protein|tara:strand:+ start:59504 stop:59623 length:120 start_codon:yes stop_codon:yes gene_type:complete